MNSVTKEIELMHHLRLQEFEETIQYFPSDAMSKSVLEIGSGTGFQLKLLKQYFGTVNGIDIGNSNYSKELQIEPVTIYDGTTIPFANETFDVVFSSNTMEHVVDLDALENEMKRVLKPGGICIHIIPSHVWKWWNTFFHYPMLYKSVKHYFDRKKISDTQKNTGSLREKSNNKLLVLISNVFYPPLHGERGNRFSEIWYFRPTWWKQHFIKNNWIINTIQPTGVYYSGHYITKNSNRKKLSAQLGSACYTFVLRKN